MRKFRGWWFGGGLVVFAGFGVWAWFLAGKSLDVADQWSSVLSGFASLVGVALAVLALVLGRPDASGAVPAGKRDVRVGGDADDAMIIAGDHNTMRRDSYGG